MTTNREAEGADEGLSDALRRALLLARMYVDEASRRHTDGTSGAEMREEARRRLRTIDDALDLAARTTAPEGRSRLPSDSPELGAVMDLMDDAYEATEELRAAAEPDFRGLVYDWHKRSVAIGADGIDDIIRAAEIAKRRGDLKTAGSFVTEWKFPKISENAPFEALDPSPQASPQGEVATEGPHVSVDEDGNAILQWRRDGRKITLYTVSDPNESLLKSWGANIDNQMEYVPLADPGRVREAFQWLARSTKPAQGEVAAPQAAEGDAKDATRYRRLAALVEFGTWGIERPSTIDANDTVYLDDKADMDRVIDRWADEADSAAAAIKRAANPSGAAP